MEDHKESIFDANYLISVWRIIDVSFCPFSMLFFLRFVFPVEATSIVFIETFQIVIDILAEPAAAFPGSVANGYSCSSFVLRAVLSS